MRNILIASMLIETIKDIVSGQIEDINESEIERNSIRIKDLKDEEIESFLELWEKDQNLGLKTFKVVISPNSSTTLPNKYIAQKGHSITWYRNNNTNGLIYIDTGTQSDEQGIKEMFTIRDRNYLDGSLRSDSFDPIHSLVHSAWSYVAKGKECSQSPSSIFVDSILQLKNKLSTFYNIPLRVFVDFVAHSVTEIISHEHALTQSDIEKILGLSLVKLNLFPDTEWFKIKTDSIISKRLKNNYYFSELTNSNGVDQEPEKLVDVAKNTTFKDLENKSYSNIEQNEWRQLCIQYCLDQKEEVRVKIPFYIFSQLFAKDTTGFKLGDKVELEISERDTLRVNEFQQLQITESLNDRSSEGAREFLEYETFVDNNLSHTPLRDLVTKATLRVLNRLAYPSARKTGCPFIETIETIKHFEDEVESNEKSLITISLKTNLSEDDEQLTRYLFVFLYGATFDEVCKRSQLDATSIQFEIDSRLSTYEAQTVYEKLEKHWLVNDDEMEDEKITWPPLPLEFELSRINDDGNRETIGSIENLEWRPNDLDWYSLMMFWTLSESLSSRLGGQKVLDNTLEEWTSKVSSAEIRVDNLSNVYDFNMNTEDTLFTDLIDIRQQFKSQVCNFGLNFLDIQTYLNSWKEILDKARQIYIPKGSLNESLQHFITTDLVFDLEHKNILMLPVHPIKLRWIMEYFELMCENITEALAGNMILNSENESYYMDHLKQMSPYQHPPMLGLDRKSLYISSQEAGWGEIYQPLTSLGEQSSEWSGNIDKNSLNEIKNTIVKYLDFHPYKTDGITILSILPGGGNFAQSLYSELRKVLKNNEGKITIHLFSPKKYWEEIIESFDSIDMINRLENTNNIFPPLDLKLHEWDSLTDIEKILGNNECDLAIVPNLFGNKIDNSSGTEDTDNSSYSGFRVLSEPTTHIDPNADKQTVSVLMKPRGKDILYENWSTLCVRLMNDLPVAPEHPEYIDYIRLSVKFQEEAELFESLHAISHWVITLDHYIGRDQIESLHTKPDVLTVRNNIGANGLYTLVISSNAGKKYIKSRIKRKLRNILDSVNKIYHKESLDNVIDTIYENSRSVAPYLVLRALGLARTTEEIIGLALAQHTVKSNFHIIPESGIVAWISLDEYSEWLGGDHETRADLCRITISKSNISDTINLEILIVESKFRQQMDLHGVHQVEKSMQFFKAIFTDQSCKDSELWRRVILSAIENSAQEACSVYENGKFIKYSNNIPIDLRDAFLEGNFNDIEVKGTYSICNYRDTKPTYEEPNGEVVIFHVNIDDLWQLNEEKTKLIQEKNKVLDEPRPIKEVKTKKDDLFTVESGMDRGGLSKAVMEEKYQLILDTYASFGIDVEIPRDVDRYTEGPASIQFRVIPGKGVAANKLKEKHEDLKLALKLDEDSNLRFSAGGGTINIDVPKSENERYYVSINDLDKWENSYPDHLIVPVGEDQMGNIVAFDFSETPHLLIAGTTGSGKSEALMTILYGLTKQKTPEQLKLILVDPKGTELQDYEDSSHLLHTVGYDEDDAKAFLEQAVEEMQRRYELMKKVRARKITEYNEKVDDKNKFPWWLIVLDEYADLTSDSAYKKEIERLLRRIVQKGRACGIHAIVATQKPSVDVIDSTLRANLGAQLALKVKSATESRVVMDEPGAETLNGKGDAFLKAENKTIRIQCAKV